MREFIDIIEKGRVYYPAIDHYNNSPNVQCDRCFRNNLEICIGYSNKDLCLPCADILANYIKSNDLNNNVLLKMEQNMYLKPQILTRMQQNFYNTSNTNNIIIDSMCLTSYPCKHNVTYNDNSIKWGLQIDSKYRTELMSGDIIAKNYWKYLTDKQKNHFGIYLNKDDILDKWKN